MVDDKDNMDFGDDQDEGNKNVPTDSRISDKKASNNLHAI